MQWKYGSLDFKSYFFLTWITSVLLVLSYPLYIIVDFIRFKFCAPVSLSLTYREHLISSLAPAQALPRMTLFIASLSTLFLFFTSTYLWYLNLDMVPVSVEFALSHSEILFVLALSWWLLRAKVTQKQLAVVICLIAGLALLTAGTNLLHFHICPRCGSFLAYALMQFICPGKSHSSRFSVVSQLWGSGIVFLATFLWGFYEVLFKRFFCA